MPTKREARIHPVMELRISGIGDGDHPFSFSVAPGDIDLDEFVGTVTVEGTLRKFGNQLLVSLVSRATHVAECDRCLCELQHEVSAPLQLYYRLTGGESTVDAEHGDDVEFRGFHPEQESIALDDEVRQTLLLELPLKTICREDCRGLCPGCGVDLNREACKCEAEAIDPRWEKLAGLFRDEN
jgi:uncharacterized protein